MGSKRNEAEVVEMEEMDSSEGGRRPTGEGSEDRTRRPKRWSAKQKRRVVLRLLRGESLDTVSRDVGVPTSKLAAWRDSFLEGGVEGLKTRRDDPAFQALAKEKKDLQAKVGELTMDIELLQEKIRRLEEDSPLASRRSKQ